jgi:hypothetical protein
MSRPSAERVVKALRQHPDLLAEVQTLLSTPPGREEPPEGYPPVPRHIREIDPNMTPEKWDAECDRVGMGEQLCHCGFRWCGSGSCL